MKKLVILISYVRHPVLINADDPVFSVHPTAGTSTMINFYESSPSLDLH